jgi:ATP-dependent helicase/nuclease subunit B
LSGADAAAPALFVSARARDRIEPVVDWLAARPRSEEMLVVGPTREVADELARRVARARGGASFGIARTTLARLTIDLAEPALARHGLVPATAAAREAVARHVVSATSASVPAHAVLGPSFARTLDELRQERIDPAALRSRAAQLAAETPDDPTRARALDDLAAWLARWPDELAARQLADSAHLQLEAIAALDAGARLPGVIAWIDVAIGSRLAAALVRAAIRPGAQCVAAVPRDDRVALAAFEACGFAPTVVSGPRATRLHAVQEGLFGDPLPPGDEDGTVVFGGAPGDAREAVEIARHVLAAAREGVPFDAIAVATRTRENGSALESALVRAGIPAWFESGTRRPHPAGRAFLALLACRAEGLSATRFAEFLSFGQARPVESVVPQRRGRWERVLREAAVFGGRERWTRRLAGLRATKIEAQGELARASPESGRIASLAEDVEAIDALSTFAQPILDALDALPASAPLASWADVLASLARAALAEPEIVVSAMDELRGASASLEADLATVLDLLDPALRWLERPRLARRHGRVLVTTPDGLRGRSMRVVLVPGLVERSFPAPVRDDPFLSDVDRAAVSPSLARRIDRSARERLLLSIAVGAAEDRLVATYPRIDARSGRSRVPSLHALEILRAKGGALPDLRELSRPPGALAASRLAWPAPATPEAAIDEAEHDLATLLDLFSGTPAPGLSGTPAPGLAAPRPASVRGGARYLLEENTHLARVMRSRYARWELRYLTPWDGARIASPVARAWLAGQRLTERPYAPTALEKFAACPYRFFLAAVMGLAQQEEAAPIERLEPATRGNLVHRALALLAAEMERRGWTAGPQAPPPEHLDEARALARSITKQVGDEARDQLAPRIGRVFDTEIEELAADVEGFVVATFRDAPWIPHRFDLRFGRPVDPEADPRSTPEPARVGPFLLRGAIDAVERHALTGELRVTDFKTGTDDTPRTIVLGKGEILQPVLYAMALDAHAAALGTEGAVGSGRLSFASARGGYREKSVFFDRGAQRAGMFALETIDAAIDRGVLPALPRKGACDRCAFRGACGPDEERRSRVKNDRKDEIVRGELDALRGRA